ncbi:MAG: hydrogenase expression/formation protein HypD [Thermoproteota archaeon]|nr:hydrogenase expression/formation protein HypD [Thermoproteota archaeon]
MSVLLKTLDWRFSTRLSKFRYRDRETADKVIKKLKEMNLEIRLMHVCGTHQDTLVRYGLDTLFRECGITIKQGPGCPVCVTTAREFEEAMRLARAGKTVATYGDVCRVPGRYGSLLDLKTEGFDVRIVYGIEDAIRIAEKSNKEVVFMAVGFETTAPSTAAIVLRSLPENFSVLSCHRYLPPALFALLEMGEFKIHGIIEPGHVSTIIGLEPYEKLSIQYHIPQVVTGFEPLDMLMGVFMLASQIKKGEAKVENEYTRVVRYEGNLKALKVIDTVFEAFNIDWRGFPEISNSGMRLKDEFGQVDSRKKYENELEGLDNEVFVEAEGCRCGDVLRGIIDSKECPLFGKTCSPTNPIGPCMVSVEGSCNIDYKYGSKRN